MSQLSYPAVVTLAAVAINTTAQQALVRYLTVAVSNGLVTSTTTTKNSTLIDPYDTPFYGFW